MLIYVVENRPATFWCTVNVCVCVCARALAIVRLCACAIVSMHTCAHTCDYMPLFVCQNNLPVCLKLFVYVFLVVLFIHIVNTM